jgi:hypothetical protein
MQDEIFYSFLGSTLTRVGAILLATFGVRILISFYKYHIRLAAFYDSLADAFEINNFSVNDNLFKLFKATNPKEIDFGNEIKLVPSELVDILKSVSTK